jgi:flagellar protein FliO/FliZ
MKTIALCAAAFAASSLPATAGAQALTSGAGPAFSPVAGIDVGGLVMSLVIVIGVILGAAYVLKRSPLALNRRSEGPLSVVASLAIGPKERLLLVEARGREVLLAVGPAGVAWLGADARASGTDVAESAEHGAGAAAPAGREAREPFAATFASRLEIESHGPAGERP